MTLPNERPETFQPAREPADSSTIFAWSLTVEKLENLLDLASDHLCEDMPFNDKTEPAIDLVDAILDGAAALARELLAEMRDV